MEKTLLIGIDCATEPKKTGLARGYIENDLVTIEEAFPGTTQMDIAAQVAQWLTIHPTALIALDAPLGWPRLLSQALQHHEAGLPLSPREVHPNQMFQRETDRIVKELTGKRPLDVGADRIARTARTALELLAQIRELTNQEIPLAWNPGPLQQTSAIEVYPAAALKVRGWPDSGYKSKDATEPRRYLLTKLSEVMEIPTSLHPVLVESDHPLDATICVLAAADFIRKEVVPPEDLELAQQEGWIWFQPKPTQQ